MQKTIFVGNGINLLNKNTKSWRDVLSELSRVVKNPQLMDTIDHTPFTLFYEVLYSKYFQKAQKSDINLKNHIANLLKNMEYNPFHSEIMNLGVRHIITTNYDYCLENSITNNAPILNDNLRKENRYNVFRRTKSSSSYVWHIHGEINSPLSIMLGYEQYGGQLQKIRTYMTTPKISPFIKGVRDFEKEKIYSWIDVFLRDEVHVIGFSFDYSEIDLWGLITYRARIQRLKKVNCGRIYYYHWTDKSENDFDRAKINLLESLGVEVIKKFDITDYSKMYESFISKFKK
ncbi:MAG: SIR2 family protein [Anaerolineales bacterium]|nr:SIR2 family protein [Anaerolineales bacterium]